jgi:hypothetical protein
VGEEDPLSLHAEGHPSPDLFRSIEETHADSQ